MVLLRCRIFRPKYFAKRFWWLFYLVGTYFTLCNVNGNYQKFRKYGSVINERHVGYKRKLFPKITFCPNSLHSKFRVAQRYSFMNETLLQAIYGGCKHDCKKPVIISDFCSIFVVILIDCKTVW